MARALGCALVSFGQGDNDFVKTMAGANHTMYDNQWVKHPHVWFAAALLTFATFALVLLPHVVTWYDPSQFSYPGFDLHVGRPIQTQLQIDRYFYDASPNAFLFFGYDLRSSFSWFGLISLSLKLPFHPLLSAKLVGYVFGLLFAVVFYTPVCPSGGFRIAQF